MICIMFSYINRNIKIIQNFRHMCNLSKFAIHFTKFEEKTLHKISSTHSNEYNKYSQIRKCSFLSDSLYDKVCRETLESLTEYFEELQEQHLELINGDISYNDGVLTINLGKKFGTYVINRQLPNKQIWLSSPISGPKRYDFEDNGWIYKHNNQTLHSLLQVELSKLLNKPIDLSQCLHFKC